MNFKGETSRNSIFPVAQGLKPVSANRPTSVPVLGRKLSSESILTVNEDKTSRYPFTIQMIKKTPNHALIATKLSPTARLKKKVKKKMILKKVAETRKSPPSSKKKPDEKCEKKGPARKHFACVSHRKTLEKNDCIMKKLVQQSIELYKKNNKKNERKEKREKKAKIKLKNRLKTLSLAAREENLKKFKFKIFRPKYPWGINEKKLERSAEKQKDLVFSEKNCNQPPKKFKYFKKSVTPDLSPVKRSPVFRRNGLKKIFKKEKLLRGFGKGSAEYQNEKKKQLHQKYFDTVCRQIKERKSLNTSKGTKRILKLPPRIEWVENEILLSSINDKSKSKSKENPHETKLSAVVKIQAATRGWLVRKQIKILESSSILSSKSKKLQNSLNTKKGELDDSSYFFQSEFSILFTSVLRDLENTLFEDTLISYLLSQVISISESIIEGIIQYEILFNSQEFKSEITEETILDFTDILFHNLSLDLSTLLLVDRQSNPLDVLSNLQESEIGSIVTQITYTDLVPPSYFLSLINTDQVHLSIFQKSIFDCINEALFDLSYKSSLPWLSPVSKKPEFHLNQIYSKIVTKLLKINSAKLGKIFNPMAKLAMTEEASNKLQETRIAAEFRQESQEDQIWTIYDFEETQIKLDISDMILDYLLDEISKNCI